MPPRQRLSVGLEIVDDRCRLAGKVLGRVPEFLDLRLQVGELVPDRLGTVVEGIPVFPEQTHDARNAQSLTAAEKQKDDNGNSDQHERPGEG